MTSFLMTFASHIGMGVEQMRFDRVSAAIGLMALCWRGLAPVVRALAFNFGLRLSKPDVSASEICRQRGPILAEHRLHGCGASRGEFYNGDRTPIRHYDSIKTMSHLRSDKRLKE